MFPWFVRTFHPILWLVLALVWTVVWRRPGNSPKSLGITFGLGLVAMLPLQAMMLQFLTVDEGGIGTDLLGRYPMMSVNFGGFKITYILLRPFVAFLQSVTDWSDDVLLRLMKAIHAAFGVGLFSLAFRLIPHNAKQSWRMQSIACLAFLAPSVFFANKILNYDSISNALALLSMIACGRYWFSGERPWAVGAFFSAALGFAEKVTVLPFLIVALAALGWSTRDRRWRELWRVYAFSLFWLVIPALIVILQVSTLTSGGSAKMAISDSFTGLLVWTMPLRNFGAIKALLTTVWAQAIFSLLVLAALLWLPGAPSVSSWIQRIRKACLEARWDVRGARALRVSLVAVVLLGVIAPHLVSPRWMALHNVAPGVITTTPLNNLSVNFDTTNPLVHTVSYFMTCSWQLVEWWPTVVIGFVLLLVLVGPSANSKLSYWLLLCGLGYLVFFVLTRNPPGHRYVAPGGVVLVAGLMLVLEDFVARLRAPLQVAALAACIAVTLLELGRYWPCAGAYRPVVMPYAVSEEVKYGDAKAPWLGWGEELALVAHTIRERRAMGETVSRVCLLYGRLLGMPDVDSKMIAGNNGRLEGGLATDWVILNRSMKAQLPFPEAEAFITIRQDGWPIAWVYRLVDVYPEALKWGKSAERERNQHLRPPASP